MKNKKPDDNYAIYINQAINYGQFFFNPVDNSTPQVVEMSIPGKMTMEQATDNATKVKQTQRTPL